MGSNVLIGVTVVFVLLVAGCGLWMNATSKKVDEAIDHAVELICYDYGYADGAHGITERAPYTDEPCVEVYSDAYEDGGNRNYDPPEAE